MSDNELIDFDPNDSEGDWDPLIPDKEQEQPEKSGSESSGGSDDEEDEKHHISVGEHFGRKSKIQKVKSEKKINQIKHFLFN